MDDSLLSRVRAAAKLAQDCGAEGAKVTLARSRGISVEWRNGALERLQDRAQLSLRLELFVAGRYSANATNDLRSETLERFVRDAVDMTRLLEPDPHRGLPDPSQYPTPDELALDLDLFDASQVAVTSEQRLSRAREIEEWVRNDAGDAPIVSVSTQAGDGYTEVARVHTNGFEATSRGTHFAMGASVVLKQDDGRRPTGFARCLRRHASDLVPPAEIAFEARERALHQLDSGKLRTGRYTVVVENRAVGRLLRAFLSPLRGSALQQKRSLWEGKVGARIASPLLTLIDEPRQPRGLGSALWDGDGFAARRRPLLEQGVLRTYLIDQYYSRKLGVEPTGGSTHGLEWSRGELGAQDLIRDVHDGIWIDRFIGGNSNETTGEISVGCGGRRITGGGLAEPISELNLSGNLASLWQSLIAVGNDPDPNSPNACPTCVFQDLQLSGV